MDETRPGRWRKRPIEVTAVRWTGDNLDAIRTFVGDDDKVRGLTEHDEIQVWTTKSRAWCTIRLGDWVIAEHDGDGFYPSSAEAFADIYEPVD